MARIKLKFRFFIKILIGFFPFFNLNAQNEVISNFIKRSIPEEIPIERIASEIHQIASQLNSFNKMGIQAAPAPTPAPTPAPPPSPTPPPPPAPTPGPTPAPTPPPCQSVKVIDIETETVLHTFQNPDNNCDPYFGRQVVIEDGEFYILTDEETQHLLRYTNNEPDYRTLTRSVIYKYDSNYNVVKKVNIPQFRPFYPAGEDGLDGFNQRIRGFAVSKNRILYSNDAGLNAINLNSSPMTIELVVSNAGTRDSIVANAWWNSFDPKSSRYVNDYCVVNSEQDSVFSTCRSRTVIVKDIKSNLFVYTAGVTRGVLNDGFFSGFSNPDATEEQKSSILKAGRLGPVTSILNFDLTPSVINFARSESILTQEQNPLSNIRVEPDDLNFIKGNNSYLVVGWPRIEDRANFDDPIINLGGSIFELYDRNSSSLIDNQIVYDRYDVIEISEDSYVIGFDDLKMYYRQGKYLKSYQFSSKGHEEIFELNENFGYGKNSNFIIGRNGTLIEFIPIK